MKKIIHILFLSCLKATELIEKNLHFKLSFKEKMQLRIHKMMCDVCTRYEKQSTLIEKGVNNIHKKEPILIDMNKLKKRISCSLDNHNKE